MSDGVSGARGTTYEMRLCMLCVVRGYRRGLTNFRLRYQVPESEIGKFDDLVFDEGGEKYQVFQLKHKEKEGKHKINSSQLFHNNFGADFSLLKYLISYFSALKDKVKMAVVMTNIDFDLNETKNQLNLLSNGKDWYQGLTSIQLHPLSPDENGIFDTSNSCPKSKCYKFDNDPNIVHILKRQAETVSRELREKLPKSTKKDVDETNKKYKNQQEQLTKKDEVLVSFLENLSEDDIREALRHIVYAVRQPNDMELEKIIKHEIKEYFKLQSVDAVYNALENAITKWCNMKEPIVDQMNNPHEIQFRDAHIFFQHIVKNISYGDNVPIKSFTGRFNELKKMREKLAEKHDVIVSQSITICGLGGIGKTELTKQFIKEFGQSDFYGRVIWIEAESDETFKKSFRGLASTIGIPDTENKSITTIINLVFDFFNGVKVLFVFDNFDKSLKDAGESSNDQEKNLVIYCRKKARDTTKKYRPYFIFTSRNRECLPGVFSLDLSVLTEEDANALIKNELKITNYTDENVEELTGTLQCFPLALQQAIAYINKQHEIARELGGGYDIKDYLTAYAKKKEQLLDYRYENDFGEHGQTTLVTWNVTFDAIKQDKTNGSDAIQILRLMSYLYADKIDAEMFLPLFRNDKTRTGKALLLLKKYSLITKIGESTCYQIHRLVQTVIQLNLKERKKDILNNVWKLIYPELYKTYLEENRSLISRLMDLCTIDQFLHYSNLATYIKNNGGRKKSFLKFFDDLKNKVYIDICSEDNIEKIIDLQLSQEELKVFASFFIKTMISKKAIKVIQYVVENKFLDLNDDSLLFVTLEEGWFDMFKYLVEKGANLNKLKLKASKDMIYDIIRGNKGSILGIIESGRTEENLTILREALFFASLFNQESIVELLIANKVEPDYKFFKENNCSLIKITAELMYPSILKILLKSFDKRVFKERVVKILFELLEEEAFCDKNCFEIIFRKYLELGGDFNARHRWKNYGRCTFLWYATYQSMKIEIIDFLLDNGANPLIKRYTTDAFINILISILRESDPDHKDQLKHVFRKIRSNISNEKFITKMNEVFKEIIDYNSINEISDLLLDENGNINFRNDNGETLLINYVRTYYGFKNVVKFLLEQGIDVDAKDNNGKNALFYAMSCKPGIFDLLLTRVSSVGEEILIKAIQKDKVNIVEDLLKSRFKQGVDVDATDHNGKNALFYAVGKDPAIFDLLLTKVSSVGEEILIEAIKKDKVNIVEILLKSRFKPNHIFEDGKTVIELILDNLYLELMFFKYPEIKEFSFQNGAAELIAVKVQMALVKYMRHCYLYNLPADFAKVDCFLGLGADVNAINSDNNNALHYAAKLGDAKTFTYLLSKDSFVHEKTLRYAIEWDKLEIVEAIIPEHFNKNHCFEDGLTPINLATKFKRNNVLKFLTDLPELFL